MVETVPLGKEPNQVEVSADGRYVFVTLHGQDALAVVDVRRREVVDSVPVGRHPHIALRSPDGNTIYVTSEGDMKLVAIDATTGKPQFEVPLFGWPRVLAVSADGRTGYQTMRWLNGILVIDFEAQRVVDRIAFAMPTFAPEGKDAHGPALTPDGEKLWLTTQTSNDVAVIRTEDRRLLRRIPVGQDPNWIGLTPDGQLAVVSNTASNDVSVIDTARDTAWLPR
ncbi:MAG: beta-propeller fold lactonase family protein [Gammaproteobacteria bacterium]